MHPWFCTNLVWSLGRFLQRHCNAFHGLLFSFASMILYYAGWYKAVKVWEQIWKKGVYVDIAVRATGKFDFSTPKGNCRQSINCKHCRPVYRREGYSFAEFLYFCPANQGLELYWPPQGLALLVVKQFCTTSLYKSFTKLDNNFFRLILILLEVTEESSSNTVIIYLPLSPFY